MSANLSAGIVEFCAHLRREHGFKVGPREARDAMRAIECAGISRRTRVAGALRSVCCSRPEEIAIFDRAFAAFFSTQPRGVAQPKPQRQLARDDAGVAGVPRRSAPAEESLAEGWELRRAQYSPAASPGDAAAIPTEGLEAALTQARRLIQRLHLARSLRWKPSTRGERFDLRRTLRAGLRTGGDVMLPHMLDHPLRNPRFVLLLDGSRSMSEHGARMLQFAYAICRGTRRASAFVFSTKLCEVTRQLRGAARRAYRLEGLGEAWGGGTRIGASLIEYLRRFSGLLSDQTFVIVMSDGLDVGEISQLQRAMHEIARRSAAIAWVNPHVDSPGYAPSADGMRAALPYLTTLVSFDRLSELSDLRRRRRMTADA
jgi:uncharacterized protein